MVTQEEELLRPVIWTVSKSDSLTMREEIHTSKTMNLTVSQYNNEYS